MRVERLLQINMAALAALGTMLLGLGQQAALLPLVAAFAAITSVYFTDIRGWFCLHRSLANLAAVLAVIFSLSDFIGGDSENQLLAIANLLIYLQIVLLYQQKNQRVYWQIAVLSLLQVVVSAALNLGFYFGILLVVYMAVALSAMMLFFLYQETNRLARLTGGSFREEPAGTGPVVQSHGDPESFSRKFIGAPLINHVGVLCFTTLIFAIVLFYSAPRAGRQVWRGGQGGLDDLVGFSQEVTLNEIGQIMQSDELVMRASFFDAETNEPYKVLGEPYFRGSVLTDYSYRSGRGKWSQAKPTLSQFGQPLEQARNRGHLVKQVITLEAAEEPVLFSVFPAFRIGSTTNDAVRYDPGSQQLFRATANRSSDVYRYTLETNAFRNGWQTPVTPRNRRMERAHEMLFGDFFEEETDPLLKIDAERFPQLIATAEQVLRDRDLVDANPASKAQALSDHLRDAQIFTYSLNFDEVNKLRNPQLDPIEDFVANHHTGHCEYFASALTLMLRSQGIPARMIVGYRGGDLNTMGNYFLVRQLHAHAWVEAFLESDEVYAGFLPPGETSPYGVWLRLDPTPASGDDPQIGFTTNLLARFGDLMDYAQLLWDDYVLGLNSERQKESIYKPLADKATAALQAVANPENWKLPSTPGSLWRFAAGLGIVLLTAALGIRVWQRRSGGKHARVNTTARRAPPTVEFYQRLKKILSRAAVVRRPGQTPREFALSLEQQVALSRNSSSALRELIEQFYRVRYGVIELSPAEQSSIETALTELEEELGKNETK